MSHEQSVMGARRDGRRVMMMASRLLAGMFALWVITSVPALAETADRNSPLSIVILGDSLTAGYGLQPGQAFPERLQAALQADGHNVVISNAGVSGDTSAGGLARLDWSVPEGTDGVIVELGANDALRGVPPEKTRENLAAIIARLQERGVSVMLAGMFAPPNMGPDYGAAFNRIYTDLAQEQSVALYPFFLDGVAAVPELNLDDGMHPNAKGIDVMVSRFKGAAIAWIETIKASRQAVAGQ